MILLRQRRGAMLQNGGPRRNTDILAEVARRIGWWNGQKDRVARRRFEQAGFGRYPNGITGVGRRRPEVRGGCPRNHGNEIRPVECRRVKIIHTGRAGRRHVPGK